MMEFIYQVQALGIVSNGETIAEAEEITEKEYEYVKGNVYHRSNLCTKALGEKRAAHMKKF